MFNNVKSYFVVSAGSIIVASGALWWTSSFAIEKEVIGTLGNVIGQAKINRDGKSLPAVKGMQVFASDKLVTDDKTAVKIQFNDGSTFMAFEKANITIEEYSIKKKGNAVSLNSAINVMQGKVRFFVKPKTEGGTNNSKFKTSNAVMGIRGTSGFIDTSIPGKTELVVLTGKVELSNPNDPGKVVTVPANMVSSIDGASAPSTPKAAPPALLNTLNSESNKVDSGQSASEEKAAEPKKDDKKDEKKDEKKDSTDKKEDKKDEKKESTDNKKDTAEKKDSSEKKPEESKKSDENKDQKDSNNDKKDSKDSNSKAEKKDSNSAATNKEEKKESPSNSKANDSNKPNEPSSEKKAAPESSTKDNAPNDKPKADSAPSSSANSNSNQPKASSNTIGGSAPMNSNNGSAMPPPPENKLVIGGGGAEGMGKSTVFNPDGLSNTVSVGGTNAAIPGLPAAGAMTGAAAPDKIANQQVMQQVNQAIEAQTTVNNTVQNTQTTAQAAIATPIPTPSIKKIQIKVVLPPTP